MQCSGILALNNNNNRGDKWALCGRATTAIVGRTLSHMFICVFLIHKRQTDRHLNWGGSISAQVSSSSSSQAAKNNKNADSFVSNK